QRDVDGRQNHFEGWREECHCILAGFRPLGEKIRLAAKVSADRFLADGGRYDRLNPPGQRLRARRFQVSERSAARSRTESCPQGRRYRGAGSTAEKEKRLVGDLRGRFYP